MTKDKKIKASIWLGFFIFIFVISFFISYSIPVGQKNANTPLPDLPLSKGEVPKAEGVKTVLEIDSTKYESSIEKNTSVYDFMDKLRTEGQINFKEKNYVGMGKFIEEINGVKGNGEKFWIFYVNNKKAEVGVSDYKINPGDIVSWKYEKDVN